MTDRLDRLFRLDGKTIVVTGAAGLLGRQHVEAIAAYGGTPVLLDISGEAVEELAADLEARYGVPAIGARVDITDEGQVGTFARSLFERTGRIDGLVNNAARNPKVEDAGATTFSRLEDFPFETWSADIAVGLTGAYLCCKHFGSLLAQNPAGGSIVNISSDLGLVGPDQRIYRSEGPAAKQPVKPVTYSVVKAGLIGLTRYMATYWPERNVRCNAICPGGIENRQPKDFLLKVSDRIPLGRLARADEYQGTLVWMLSDSSSYLNGAIVAVDGGRTAW